MITLGEYEMENLIVQWGIRSGKIKRIYSTAWEIGDAYILKAYDDLSGLERNLQVTRLLSEKGIPVPEVICLKDGEAYLLENGKYYILTKKLPGQHLTAGQLNGEMAGRMGEILGDLHLAFQKCEAAPNLWENSLLAELKGWVRQALEKEGWHLVKQAEFQKTVSRLESVYDELPKQLIHRDVHFGNFLFADGKLSGYIDFDLSQKNIRIFDICYFLLGLLTEETGDSIAEEEWFEILRNVAAGYEKRIALRDVEKNAAPDVMAGIELLFAAYFVQQGEECSARNAAGLFQYIVENRERIDKAFFYSKDALQESRAF